VSPRSTSATKRCITSLRPGTSARRWLIEDASLGSTRPVAPERSDHATTCW
jgi:hypothetical protein